MAHIHNIPDFKNLKGCWAKSVTLGGNTYHTRASILWNNIKKRTGFVGNYQELNISYLGCKNLFEGYQEFTEWCQDQKGYNSKETNGRFWTLDKDIVGDSNYSPLSCVFIPHEINVITTNVEKKNVNPIGVTIDRGCIRAKEGTIDLGYHASLEDAHRAWQVSKLSKINFLIAKWEDFVDYRVVVHLNSYTKVLSEDIRNNRETLGL